MKFVKSWTLHRKRIFKMLKCFRIISSPLWSKFNILMKELELNQNLMSFHTSARNAWFSRFSKHRYLVKKEVKNLHIFDSKRLPPISMIVNPVFSKSGKGLSPILKHQTKISNKLVLRLEIFRKGVKKHLSVYSDKW